MEQELNSKQEDIMIEQGLEKFRGYNDDEKQDIFEKDGYPDVSIVKCPSCSEEYLDVDMKKCDDGEYLCCYCYEDLIINC